MDDATKTCREAVELRLAAQDWGKHAADEPRDMDDTLGKRRWKRLADAAIAFARKARGSRRAKGAREEVVHELVRGNDGLRHPLCSNRTITVGGKLSATYVLSEVTCLRCKKKRRYRPGKED